MDISRKAIIRILIGQEIFLIIISLFWIYIGHPNTFKISGLYGFMLLSPFRNMEFGLKSLGIGIAASLILVSLSLLITLTYEPFKKSMITLDQMIISKIEKFDIIPVALLSGIAEELFFRGILQTSIGLYASNIIFALLHFPGKEFWVYSLWTLFAGLFLGNIYDYTNNLFIVIVAHVMNNFLALVLWKKFRHKFIK